MAARTILPFIFFLALTGLELATAGVPGEGSALDRQIQNQQGKIQRLQAGLTSQREQLSQSQAKETDLLGELNHLDQDLQSKRLHLTEVQEKLTQQKQLTAAKEVEVAAFSKEHEHLREHIQKRLKAFYQVGDLGILNALFATTTLPELITFDLYFRRILRHDQQTIGNYRAQLQNLADHRQALAAEEAKSEELIIQLQATEKELLASREERELLLQRVQSEEKLYRHALREIEEATSLLSGTLTQLLAKEPKSLPPARLQPGAPPKTTFSSQKGALNPPTLGPVSSTFGSAPGKFGTTTHTNGISIQAPPGAEVSAIFRGTIVYAGPLKGYGQIVIIDHGQEYFSLVGHLGKILSAEGRAVATGEVIGRMGEGTGLLEEGAHFEIRHGSQAVDPLPWLNPERLPVRTGSQAAGAPPRSS